MTISKNGVGIVVLLLSTLGLDISADDMVTTLNVILQIAGGGR